MTDTFDAIKRVWEHASQSDRTDYLFQALVCISDKIDKIPRACLQRKVECDQSFVTKKQARWFAAVVLALALGIGIGSGYITFKEFLDRTSSMLITDRVNIGEILWTITEPGPRS